MDPGEHLLSRRFVPLYIPLRNVKKPSTKYRMPLKTPTTKLKILALILRIFPISYYKFLFRFDPIQSFCVHFQWKTDQICIHSPWMRAAKSNRVVIPKRQGRKYFCGGLELRKRHTSVVINRTRDFNIVL